MEDSDFIVFGDFKDPEELKPKPPFIVFGDFLTPEDYLVREDTKLEDHLIRADHSALEDHPVQGDTKLEDHLIRVDHSAPEDHPVRGDTKLEDHLIRVDHLVRADTKLEDYLPDKAKKSTLRHAKANKPADPWLNKTVGDVVSILAKYGSLVCKYCQALENIELGCDNKIEGVFCESCRIIIGNSLQYQCPGQSQQCLKTRFIGPTGLVSRLCRECHQSAENRCHGGHISCLKFRYTDPAGNVTPHCINCSYQESLLNRGYQPKLRRRK